MTGVRLPDKRRKKKAREGRGRMENGFPISSRLVWSVAAAAVFLAGIGVYAWLGQQGWW